MRSEVNAISRPVGDQQGEVSMPGWSVKRLSPVPSARPVIMGVAGEACRLIDRADAGICVEPENTYSLIILAQGQARQGDHAGAIETLEKARAVEPRNQYVRTTLERLRAGEEDADDGG